VSPPSALSLYRLSLAADETFAYSGRKYLTEWHEDDRIFASVEDVSHEPPASDLTVYLAPRSRKGRQVLQVHNEFWTYVPDSRMIVHSFMPTDESPPEQTARFGLLLKNYSLSVSPKPTTVAGRKAFEVSIKPPTPGRPYALLWIDPTTGVVLRREEYHSDGALSSVSYFGEIHFHPKFTADEFLPGKWNGRGARIVDQPMHQDALVSPTRLPASFVGKAVMAPSLNGFELQKVTILRSGGNEVLHLLYSDGLNPLSVYEAPKRGKAPTPVPFSHRVSLGGGVYGRASHQYAYVLLNWDTPAMNFTLVSDISEENLVKIAIATGTVPTGPVVPVRARHG
jgi:hypothetical protein